MEHEWQRAKSLVPEQAIADTDYQQAVSNFEVAKANLALGHAAVQLSTASLCVARTNLNYTTIKSPVDGIIIDRRVNIGQTVVSAFNAPSLFVIAKDLRRVQVWASVNEADIGQIQLGQTVQFTLDTYQGQLFSGKVSQIRLNAARTCEPNSAIYTVIVAAANTFGILPYLTANVEFEVQRHPNVLLIPTVALCSQPSENAASASVSEPLEPAVDNGRKHTTVGLFCFAKSPRHGRLLTGYRRLWIKDGKMVHPLDVQLGLSNDEVTEIISPNVKEGMDVVLAPSNSHHGV
jgi:HlyD family secretion protein